MWLCALRSVPVYEWVGALNSNKYGSEVAFSSTIKAWSYIFHLYKLLDLRRSLLSQACKPNLCPKPKIFGSCLNMVHDFQNLPRWWTYSETGRWEADVILINSFTGGSLCRIWGGGIIWGARVKGLALPYHLAISWHWVFQLRTLTHVRC